MFSAENAPRLAIGSLILMIAALIITIWMGYGFSVGVMMLIATAGFLTIVFVMIIGSTHGESPVAASDSEAVARWNERVANRVQNAPVIQESEAKDVADDDTDVEPGS